MMMLIFSTAPYLEDDFSIYHLYYQKQSSKWALQRRRTFSYNFSLFKALLEMCLPINTFFYTFGLFITPDKL